MKLWDKGGQVDAQIENFTVGMDRELDHQLAKYDVLGSIAHITMLESIDLLEKEELLLLVEELRRIYHEIEEGNFKIEEGVEDVHSQVELILTERLGDLGKKIHSGRSRNDQVLVDLKLFFRDKIREVVGDVVELFLSLMKRADKHKGVLIPGYTHLQVAMPSSFGLWFGAYAESLIDDVISLQSAYKISNQNPLGSAAGYGSSFPLNRQMTTDLLRFESMNYNVVYAQMGRGRVEKNVAFGLANVASTLSKMAMDVCLYMSQNFDFLTLPDALTTGSSIMPHKKNPDVFELLRSHCNRIQGLPNQITLMMNNLPSGYFRDLQLIKEEILPAIDDLQECIHIAQYAIDNLKIKDHIIEDPKYRLVFSVEEVNKRVLDGVPFRDAYKQVGQEIEAGQFETDLQVHHTHEGSIGNLCLAQVKLKMQHMIDQFNFEKLDEMKEDLIGE
ncbi:argininosuccinate lyase [Halosquirtibacter xylanolyticus]|uniref:argininosuccinate lyase n=1 Tax=Halosquirtibacter xylanolyticus TaxID=3374599 RepID=UPI00374A7620|nr:argininosuccinate lyase [Prolixibacteraceae bacterium]